jgi:hypothetical protein
MAYHNIESIPLVSRGYYVYRKRTLNSYYAITTDSWRYIMKTWRDTKYERWIYSCGKIEGEKGSEFKGNSCRFCGNCIREYYATLERMRIYE